MLPPGSKQGSNRLERMLNELAWHGGRVSVNLDDRPPILTRMRSRPIAPTATTFEEQIYCAAVREDDVCFDVGANVGDVSVLLSRLVGQNGHVVAFEPVWPVYRQLCRRVQIAAGEGATIVPVPLGLAEVERAATIQVPNDEFPMGSLAAADVWGATLPDQTITSHECRFTTMDGFVAVSGSPVPDFVKIDVEGAELLVLQGAELFFEQGHRPLMLIEVFAPWERAFGYGPWRVLGPLAELGYEFLFACPEGLVAHEPSASEPFPADYVRGYNVLAQHPDLHAERVEALRPLRRGGSEPILPMPLAPVPNTAV